MREEFIREIREILGGETDAFLAALEQKPTLGLRVNALRPGSLRHALDFIADPVPWAKDAYYQKEDVRPGKALAHDLGAYYLQEASAMVSAGVLDAKPGEKVLDLCAAPGGKTGQIAAAMMGRGLLISNEPVPSRAKVLAENLERLAVVNAAAVCAYPDQLADRWGAMFDAVLTDAPCSGEGMFRRDPAARDEWQPGSPAGCARRQAEILDAAARLVRPGGRLVYSTCTFNRQENEGSILGFLERHPEFSPADFHLDGIGDSENGMLRVWPHRARGDGHFVAKLVKAEDGERIRGKKEKPPKRPKPDDTRDLVRRLEDESCALPEVLSGARLIRQGDYVHALPEGTPDLDTIRVVKPGLCLMRVGRSHVQPMPALARACGGAEHLARARYTFETDEDTARRFLAGERLEASDGKRRWTLITWNGLPVGWQKM